MNLRRGALSLLLTFVASSLAAGPITIFNTGVDALGAVVPTSSIDLHYTIVSGPAAFPGPNAFVSIDTGFPIPPWIANSPTSMWISPAANPNQEFGFGATFIYRTTFDLTGLQPATAVLSGQWASDNQTLQILLNGVDTGIPTNCADSTADVTCFTMFDPISITSGFVGGLNTLDFVVRNGAVGVNGGPSGLRVEISGTASAVPEPASLVLMGVGLLGLGVRARRR